MKWGALTPPSCTRNDIAKAPIWKHVIHFTTLLECPIFILLEIRRVKNGNFAWVDIYIYIVAGE